MRDEIVREAQRIDALGHLTGGIAHDSSNLLQAVQRSLSLIAWQAEDPDRVRVLAVAGLDSVGRGSRLASQLLAFSRHQQIELRPAPVAARVRGLQDLLQGHLVP